MSPPLVCPSNPVVRAVIDTVCTSHGVSVNGLIDGSHEYRFVRARREIARTFFEAPYGWSLSQIGRALGGMHHTSIRHLIKTDNPKPRCRPNKNIASAAAADLESRISDVENRRKVLRAKLADLDVIDEKLHRALALLANSNAE